MYTCEISHASSGEAETYAAGDAAKLGIHFHNVGEEVGLKVSKPVKIYIDAQAAKGFIQNTGVIGRMKHIDLREAWLDILRSDTVEFLRVPGEDNEADFFTKILQGPSFVKATSRLMQPLKEK